MFYKQFSIAHLLNAKTVRFSHSEALHEAIVVKIEI